MISQTGQGHGRCAGAKSSPAAPSLQTSAWKISPRRLWRAMDQIAKAGMNIACHLTNYEYHYHPHYQYHCHFHYRYKFQCHSDFSCHNHCYHISIAATKHHHHHHHHHHRHHHHRHYVFIIIAVDDVQSLHPLVRAPMPKSWYRLCHQRSRWSEYPFLTMIIHDILRFTGESLRCPCGRRICWSAPSFT